MSRAALCQPACHAARNVWYTLNDVFGEQLAWLHLIGQLMTNVVHAWQDIWDMQDGVCCPCMLFAHVC